MVDLHTHILPDIDDGAADWNESLAMSKMAYEDGIRTIVATPHIGKFPNTQETILSKTKELSDKIKTQGLSLELFSGSDFQFHCDIFKQIHNKSVCTINHSRYLILDIAYFLMPPNVKQHIGRIVALGITPIIAHPERCLQIQEDLEILYEIIKAGALVQITASSLTGKMGRKAQDTAFVILRHNLSHIIASDAHNTASRPPLLSEAVALACRFTDKATVLPMVTTTPQAIIDNKPLEIPQPKKP